MGTLLLTINGKELTPASEKEILSSWLWMEHLHPKRWNDPLDYIFRINVFSPWIYPEVQNKLIQFLTVVTSISEIFGLNLGRDID
jgi:hypothetical protein